VKKIRSIVICVIVSSFFAVHLVAQPLPPLKVGIDCSDAPQTQEWAEKIAAIAKEQYPLLVAMLDSEGYKPADSIMIVIRHMDGVGYASGRQIHISVNRVNSNPEGVGVIVHELIHILQAYRGMKREDGWVTEGIADYLRFFVYERNGEQTCRVNPDRHKYTDSYRITGAFFNWIVLTHDAGFIKKLNAACRYRNYSIDLFREYTGLTVDELWDGFIQSIRNKNS